ncbi:hypothetical protein [Paraburkholderia sp. C35]|uniref:plasmid mobilization protein n=1 Tax=Paraburkholderia sp. C35 TaxID=2126993 RepID=UPI000D685DFF|nr:hypothetical protein [Paraburkholderia sp. C35]
MNKPSERIVVFVTPAQKRAIASTAENLGISVSELMRRAVLSFGATSEQVKAASIVDRLRAPREPDALNEALRRVARAGMPLRQATPPALRSPAARDAATPVENDTVFADADPDGSPALASLDFARPVVALATPTQPDVADSDADGTAAAQAAARVTAAKAAALAAHDEPATSGTLNQAAATHAPSRTSTLLTSKRNAAGKRQQERDDDEPGIDPAEGSGHFA